MEQMVNNKVTNDRFALIKKIIERNGFKFTKQRKLILEQLFVSDRHLTAEEIYEKLKDDNIGLATVYRNVRMFSNIGIIKEIIVDGVSHYELKIYSKNHCISISTVLSVMI